MFGQAQIGPIWTRRGLMPLFLRAFTAPKETDYDEEQVNAVLARVRNPSSFVAIELLSAILPMLAINNTTEVQGI
ncbi:MAG: hypothetical protein ABJN34_05620 [Litoreibacter sp.]|uniref:hypothetical protein n=1 Tax=Litoreibacter sp. TaxID=1969459 RepID=UPI003298DCFF